MLALEHIVLALDSSQRLATALGLGRVSLGHAPAVGRLLTAPTQEPAEQPPGQARGSRAHATFAGRPGFNARRVQILEPQTHQGKQGAGDCHAPTSCAADGLFPAGRGLGQVVGVVAISPFAMAFAQIGVPSLLDCDGLKAICFALGDICGSDLGLDLARITACVDDSLQPAGLGPGGLDGPVRWTAKSHPQGPGLVGALEHVGRLSSGGHSQSKTGRIGIPKKCLRLAYGALEARYPGRSETDFGHQFAPISYIHGRCNGGCKRIFPISQNIDQRI